MSKTSADDMSNRQIFETLSDILYVIVDNMASKTELQAMGERLSGIESKMATKHGLAKLEAKVDHMRAGLAKAAEPI